MRKEVVTTQSFNRISAPVLCWARHSSTFNRIVDRYFAFWYSDERELERYFRELKQAAPEDPESRRTGVSGNVQKHTN
jgi:hypothetical protein